MSGRIVSFDELNRVLTHPFNDPNADVDYVEGLFLEENQRIHELLKQHLTLLGDFDQDETDDNNADFWIPKGGGITRCISVTLTSRKMWSESLIFLIQSFLKSLSKDYLVFVDSGFELEQPIYLLITKDEVIGSAENPCWLEPFGLRP